MPEEQFPLQPHVFGPGGQTLSIDRTSLQELSDEDGRPIIAFTAKGGSDNGSITDAVPAKEFNSSGKVNCDCILVKVKIPRGLRRVDSLLGDTPQLYGGANAGEVVAIADDAPVMLTLAALLTDIEPRELHVGILPEDLSKFAGTSGNHVVNAAHCGTTANPCRKILVDTKGRYISFEWDWKTHYSQAMKSFAQSNKLPEGPIHVVPNLIARKSNKPTPNDSDYVIVYNLFTNKADREQFHNSFDVRNNDFEAAFWKQVKVPIPGLKVRLDTKMLNICRL